LRTDAPAALRSGSKIDIVGSNARPKPAPYNDARLDTNPSSAQLQKLTSEPP
jgi:hypothetical protein